MVPDDYNELWGELSGLLFVPLTRGAFATIDASDYTKIAGRRWCVSSTRNGGARYATRSISYGTVNGKRRGGTIWMHRVIAGTPRGMETDHKNGNGLNNHRSNLRICTHRQNMHNVRRHKSDVGISVTGKGEYLASFSGRVLGRFSSRSAAQDAHDRAAQKARGEFAYLHAPQTVDGKQIVSWSGKGYRGAYQHGQRRHLFQCIFRGKHVGLFKSIEEAAEAYDRKAIAYYGDSARLNFPERRAEYQTQLEQAISA